MRSRRQFLFATVASVALLAFPSLAMASESGGRASSLERTGRAGSLRPQSGRLPGASAGPQAEERCTFTNDFIAVCNITIMDCDEEGICIDGDSFPSGCYDHNGISIDCP